MEYRIRKSGKQNKYYIKKRSKKGKSDDKKWNTQNVENTRKIYHLHPIVKCEIRPSAVC